MYLVRGSPRVVAPICEPIIQPFPSVVSRPMANTVGAIVPATDVSKARSTSSPDATDVELVESSNSPVALEPIVKTVEPLAPFFRVRRKVLPALLFDVILVYRFLRLPDCLTLHFVLASVVSPVVPVVLGPDSAK